jgi:hypothetical protein
MGAFLCVLVLGLAAAGELDSFVGEWHGDSTCVAKNTACHDETVVYRIAEIPGKSGYASVSADKIVNGNAVNMGTLEFRNDHGMLICEYAQGVWQLKMDHGKIQGTLTRADGTVFRQVDLRKEPVKRSAATVRQIVVF